MIFVWFMAAALLFLAGYITNTAMNDKTTEKALVGEYQS